VSYSFVKLKIANVRTEPSHRSELDTQILRGWPVYVISTNEKGDWHQIITVGGIKGYIESGALVASNEEEFAMWLAAPKQVLAQTYGHYLSGSLAIIRNASQQFTELIFPDRVFLELEKPNLVPLETTYNPAEIVAQAQQYLGVQYLWGGISELGFDCSGFIQHLFLLQGFILPRNSGQQALIGKQVEINDLQEGDLIFMGELENRISHVVLYMNESAYIHSSAQVGINAIDPTHKAYDAKRKALIQWAKRYHQSNLLTLTNALEQFSTNTKALNLS
jgi:hypothetical protein